ncbi:penicillin-binding transpeptidase domain-containing protein [Brumimicrobium mesophilum]|uniref:penicillin-binding transpeptidase domain-containing protein n=1 Tax=Brumimicrobium mesophilum TaxID=392717 RepID=UPI000D1429F5|nr:penicillin-binding transpeptidase domain-containing protein [Brumimicrobium mesophilum]
MKYIFILFLCILGACNQESKSNIDTDQNENPEIIKEEFQTILDEAGIKGSILIWNENKYYSNDFELSKKGYLPASTFKIPNSIIAIELGIVGNDSTIIKWDGKSRFQKRWEQDLSFKEAFHYSCVPCYQEIARTIGVQRMKTYLNKMNYGKMIFDSTNLDMFWLQGKSRISQFQQISFLKIFNEQRLPISKRTHTIMRRLMIIEDNKEYTLRGKTGWSVVNDKNNLWYVGFVENDHGFYYFATNIEPGEETNLDKLIELRKTVTKEALIEIGAFK